MGILLAVPHGVTVDVQGEKREGLVLLPSQVRELAFSLLTHAESVSAVPDESLWLSRPDPRDREGRRRVSRSGNRWRAEAIRYRAMKSAKLNHQYLRRLYLSKKGFTPYAPGVHLLLRTNGGIQMKGSRLRQFVFLALLAPLAGQAGIITVGGFAGGVINGAGVDLEVTVLPNGAFEYGLADLHATASWGLGLTLISPVLPSGSVINSATLSWSLPVAFLYAEIGEPVLYATASSELTSVDFVEDCGNGNFASYSQATTSVGAIQFVPCSSSFYVFPTLSGTTDIELTGWSIPSTPGIYENALLLSENISYSLSVDYAPPAVDPEVVPEPSFLWIFASFAVCGILATALRRNRNVAAK
jgi:hypothetical protein